MAQSFASAVTPKHIFGVPLSQPLRQWRIWRTGSAAYAPHPDTATIADLTFAGARQPPDPTHHNSRSYDEVTTKL